MKENKPLLRLIFFSLVIYSGHTWVSKPFSKLPVSFPLVAANCESKDLFQPRCIIIQNPKDGYIHHSKKNRSGHLEYSSDKVEDPVPVLFRGDHFAVVAKPPSIPCHNSKYVGKRADGPRPLLQRTRDTLGQRVNLVHRLDRGASGCVLVGMNQEVTAALQIALQEGEKTYYALVRGEGSTYRDKGWFEISREIKDENGKYNDAITSFKFLQGSQEPRGCLVQCEPKTGRWHQIRRHLNGISHPIIGDSSHGVSHTNREWRTYHGVPNERICLHLARIILPPTKLTPALDVCCPFPKDLRNVIMNLPFGEEVKKNLPELFSFNDKDYFL
mmetsp:Transcript_36619/g.46659  ORF Transcript_36619/g.46659 Transcript_36619/m.46659 type:complete len:329 (+) Transcript_36619:40-1026(+)